MQFDMQHFDEIISELGSYVSARGDFIMDHGVNKVTGSSLAAKGLSRSASASTFEVEGSKLTDIEQRIQDSFDTAGNWERLQTKLTYVREVFSQVLLHQSKVVETQRKGVAESQLLLSASFGNLNIRVSTHPMPKINRVENVTATT